MAFLDPVLNPLLKLPILLALILISFIIALIISVIYKYTTNQDLMKSLKEEMKSFQKQIKELKQDPQKMMAVQKKAMEVNMKYMMQSMKSTLFTFIPIIIIFGWMTAHLAYEPIRPGQDFTTTVQFAENMDGNIELSSFPKGITIDSNATKEIKDSKVSWLLMGNEGEYQLEYKFDGQTYKKDVLITNEQNYKEPITKLKDSKIKTIQIDNAPLKMLNLFGWKIGWLGSYIIFSIVFSMLLRKLMKLY